MISIAYIFYSLIHNEGQENKELNEAYSQRDEDYEEEGSDDPDIDGDYKEN